MPWYVATFSNSVIDCGAIMGCHAMFPVRDYNLHCLCFETFDRWEKRQQKHKICSVFDKEWLFQMFDKLLTQVNASNMKYVISG